MSRSYDYLKEVLTNIKQAGLWRQMEVADDFASASRIVIGGRELINLCSNNYLGLASHAEVKKAACEATRKWGCGATASRLMSGNTGLHRDLEKEIARFKRTEAALVFPSGYMANLGIISALTGPGDVIYSDRLNHASIVDGIVLSRAGFKRYRHNDAEHLEKLLRENINEKDQEPAKLKKTEKGKQQKDTKKTIKKPRKIIITDTVFSMDGDIAPLPEIAVLARKYNCLLIVDEAHATGVLGVKSRGVVEHFGLENDIDVHMGTLSKALGAQGGYVAGSKQLIDYLINKSRSFIFTTGLAPAMAGAALKSLEIISNDNSHKDKLWENIDYFSKRIKDAGFDTGESQTQIIPLLIGDTQKAVEFSKLLYKAGVFTRAVRPPTVPEGTARIRISLTAGHTKNDLEQVIEVLITAGQKLGLIGTKN